MEDRRCSSFFLFQTKKMESLMSFSFKKTPKLIGSEKYEILNFILLSVKDTQIDAVYTLHPSATHAMPLPII